VGSLATDVENEVILNEALEKLEKDPKYRFTDEELTLVEKKANGTLPEIEESETKEVTPDKEEVKSELKLPDFNVDTLMKKTGAKNPNELESKFEGMKKRLSSRVEEDPLYQEALEKTTESESNYKKGQELVDSHVGFITDLQNNIPLAIQHLEKLTGLKIHKGGDTPKEKVSTDYDDFLDPEMAQNFDKYKGETSSMFSEMQKQIEELKNLDSTREDQYNKQQTIESEKSVKREISDEMVIVASRMNLFKDTKDPRALIERWQNRETSKQDSQLIDDSFTELFTLANKHEVDLNTAQDILNGRKAPLLVEQAKIEAKKETYNRPKNMSLSGMQNSQYQHNDGFTREVIEDIIRKKQGATRFPDKWFDKDHRLIENMIPKHSRDLFGFQM